MTDEKLARGLCKRFLRELEGRLPAALDDLDEMIERAPRNTRGMTRKIKRLERRHRPLIGPIVCEREAGAVRAIVPYWRIVSLAVVDGDYEERDSLTSGAAIVEVTRLPSPPRAACSSRSCCAWSADGAFPPTRFMASTSWTSPSSVYRPSCWPLGGPTSLRPRWRSTTSTGRSGWASARCCCALPMKGALRGVRSRVHLRINAGPTSGPFDLRGQD